MQARPNRSRRAATFALLTTAGALILCIWTGAGSPSPATDETRTIESQGRTWQYLFHRPPSVAPATPAPLVVVLHGSPDTPQAMAARTRFDVTADENGFLVAYPNLPLSPGGDSGGPSKIQVVADIIDLLEKTERAQPNRVFVTGFSGGAVQTYRIACEYGDKVAAVAPVSGVMIRPDCTGSRPVSVYAVNGTSDGTFPFNGGKYTGPVQQTVDRWLSIDRCPGAPARTVEGPVQRTTWGPCSGGTTVQLDAVVQGVHAWPGDPAYRPGTPDGDFQATPAIWRFFAQHGRPAPAAALRISIVRVTVARSRTVRVVKTTIQATAPTRINVALLRGTSVVASHAARVVAPGRVSVALRIPRRVGGGSYRLRGSAGAVVTTRRITLPPP